ncbi:zinc ABC transporter permease AztB [Nocardia sp. NBC_01329]|uniref:zinc ABC transporter permease AztB n=1 Tax=Nocardia sp. NBC_01329 TaxID=2903594 RepID=UPI002E13613F|nr:zinc ABC transporter permease AztB [Nocardia sp. NBC_01329]
MDWLIAPFEVTFVQRALWGGLLVSCLCALAGTWVVVRGMAFLGEAMAHGMLPGIAVAALLGGNLLLGAVVSASAMAAGVSVLSRNRRLSTDTGIGLLFVGMLAIGVILISRSQSFAVDLTGFLFGDVLATRPGDLLFLLSAVGIALVITVLGHRAFLALAFDPRTAQTLGLRPRRAQIALLALLTLAIAASFHVVGTLLVFGLLVAPPAAATYCTHRIPRIMLLAAGFGGLATVAGLLISWHARTAAGATIAATAVAIFFTVATGARLRAALRGRSRGGPGTGPDSPRPRTGKYRAGRTAGVVTTALLLVPVAACGSAMSETTTESVPHGYIEGAEESAGARAQLVIAERSSGGVRILDLVTEEVLTQDPVPGVAHIADDGRYAYLAATESTTIIDSGSWVVDHGDHVHYYRAQPRRLGTLPGSVRTAHSDTVLAAPVLGDGSTALTDRAALDEGTLTPGPVLGGAALPYGGHLLVADAGTGSIQVRDRENALIQTLEPPCARPGGQTLTRRGAVFSCADGALVVRERDHRFSAEKMPYPAGTTGSTARFFHRRGSDVLVAVRDSRVLVLDLGHRSWRSIETGPVTAATTAGAGTDVLTLDPAGVLHSYDPETGAETAQRPVLSGPVDPARPPVLLVDAERAYVNDPAGRRVHEIDYADGLRIARTFDLEITPDLMVETGR